VIRVGKLTVMESHPHQDVTGQDKSASVQNAMDQRIIVTEMKTAYFDRTDLGHFSRFRASVHEVTSLTHGTLDEYHTSLLILFIFRSHATHVEEDFALEEMKGNVSSQTASKE
jgi:hypothetical protein